MKILYISLTGYLIYVIRFRRPYCLTYDSQNDSFPHLKFIYPGAALVTLISLDYSNIGLFEICWTYSIWLESLAILPQLHMIQQTKECENITGHYMASLGFYRFFYILNWIYVYYQTERIQWISTLGGILQTALYSDFLYVYLKSYKQTPNLLYPGHANITNYSPLLSEDEKQLTQNEMQNENQDSITSDLVVSEYEQYGNNQFQIEETQQSHDKESQEKKKQSSEDLETNCDHHHSPQQTPLQCGQNNDTFNRDDQQEETGNQNEGTQTNLPQ